jgi:hypothetical protein
MRDGGRERVDVLGRCFDTIAQHFAHQIREHRVVGARPGCKVMRREPRRLGIARVDDPDLRMLREVTDRAPGIRQPDGMPMGDNGIAADQHCERGVVVVGPPGQRRRAAHQLGHQDLRGPVDGQRAELRRRADGGVQRLRDPIADRVHAHAGTEVDPDGFRSVLVDGVAQLGAEVVEAGLPGRVVQRAVDTHLRVLKPVRMVVDLRQGAALGAGVAVRERMLAVAVHRDDVVAVDLDEDPADRRADPAEASDCTHKRTVLSRTENVDTNSCNRLFSLL